MIPQATTDRAITARTQSGRVTGTHALRALRAVAVRELVKFSQQKGRLFAALVRPTLWLVVFAVGFQDAFGTAALPPYAHAVTYREYIVPGLIGIVLLFNGMQNALSLVYDREMGVMRLLLTAPLPRWYLLLCKLLAGTALSLAQVYAFLIIAALFGVGIPWAGWLYVLPASLAAGLLLGAIGLLLSVHIRQLENFAGTMNFVIFPMFFLSGALYPLARFAGHGHGILYALATVNPFTHAVELIRFAAYGRLDAVALAVVVGVAVACFLLAVRGYDPQRGLIRRRPQGGPPA